MEAHCLQFGMGTNLSGTNKTVTIPLVWGDFPTQNPHSGMVDGNHTFELT